jgi:hypothetical protein
MDEFWDHVGESIRYGNEVIALMKQRKAIPWWRRAERRDLKDQAREMYEQHRFHYEKIHGPQRYF